MEIATTTTTTIPADLSYPPPPNLAEQEEEEDDDDEEFDPDPNKCDYLYTKFSNCPSHFKLPYVSDDIEFTKLLDHHILSNANTLDYGDIDPKYELSLCIWRMPEYIWRMFYNKYPHHLKPAIKLAATLLYSLIPKTFLYRSPTYNEWARQLNHLWESLTVLLQRLPQPDSLLDEAFSLIMDLTNNRQKYSLVDETDVAKMIELFSHRLQYSLTYPLYPYKDCTSKIEKVNDHRLKEIMQVVDEIELPSMLQATYYSQVLTNILKGGLDKDDLLRRLKIELVSYYGEESPPFILKLGFDNIVDQVIELVKRLLVGQLASVFRPFWKLCGLGHEFHISPEVSGLISVAEIRRIASRSRFISRSHLLWAFYDRGYVLPPQIRQTIKLISAEENHPPFHIYRASGKLAEYFSEKVQLENFIFCVINSGDIGLSADMSEMSKLALRYEEFLEVLYNSSPDPSDRARKRPKRT